MKMVTITNSGITQTVPENELPIYTRAGYKVVEEIVPEPIAQDESDLLAKIEAATSIKDLYSLMDEFPKRSAACELALNAKGIQLTEVEEKPAPVADPKPDAPEESEPVKKTGKK